MGAYEKTFLKKSDDFLLKDGKYLSKTRTGLYSIQELGNMINNDSYIPVASASELDGLRNSVSQTMGSGTQWEGTYTTGLDKKYVQVRDIDLGGYTTQWQTLSQFVGIYDGNRLRIDNLTSIQNADRLGLFNSENNDTVIIRNIILQNAYIDATDFRDYNAGICVFLGGSESLIENCDVINSYIRGQRYTAGFVSYNGFTLIPIDGGTIRGCRAYNNVIIGRDITIRNAVAGISMSNLGLIENCEVIGCDIFIGGSGAWGISSGGTVKNCISKNNKIKCNEGAYGIGGGNVENCISENNTIEAISSYAGGLGSGNYKNCKSLNNAIIAPDFVGGASGKNNGTIENCYSTSYIDSTGVNVGGLVGDNNGTVTNSYYNSQTSGQSDTGKGEPRTTKQLQNGTADSFINPDGTPDPTEASANAMFTGWKRDNWLFNPKGIYPRLKPSYK